MSDRPSVFDFSPEGFAELCKANGLPAFLGKQVLDWVYAKGVTDPQAMSNLSKANRERLAELIDFEQGVLLAEQLATDGTRKLLLGWPLAAARPEGTTALPILGADGAPAIPSSRQTECVMIPNPERRTACVSS